ncbi:hypothetical protein MIND_00018800 [Mycena indigotica]|uniref:Cyclase n=1 Tax=Mycena indigotica TaxID=2126181 RepID=A0A8H6WFR9_9AGAR|nr:uncharacterized protein MIND_00018800 [Mycena indigotica]KAF7315046.1 hypothetical protein MIND_00018800 [Mycena indigotica]
MMPQIIDLTHTLDESTPTYPGDPPFLPSCAASIAHDGYAVTKLSLSSHAGTHIDAPAHFVAGGRTIDKLAIHELVGRVVVLDISAQCEASKPISRNIIQRALQLAWSPTEKHDDTPMPMLFIQTGWSRHWSAFAKTYFTHPFLSREAAEYIVSLGFRVVGIDALSPDETRVAASDSESEEEKAEEQGSFAAHETILGANGVIAENLTNLGMLGNGQGFTIHLVPLKLDGCDGSPVRAYALRSS